MHDTYLHNLKKKKEKNDQKSKRFETVQKMF